MKLQLTDNNHVVWLHIQTHSPAPSVVAKTQPIFLR